MDAFFEAGRGDETRYQLLEPDARLIWTCEAASWNRAQQKRYDFMGWGAYRTIEEDL